MRRLFFITPLLLSCLASHAQDKTAGSYEFLPVPPTPALASNTQVITNPIPQPPDLTVPAVADSNVSNVDLSADYVTDDKHKLLYGDRVSFRILEDRDPPNTPQRILTVTDSGELDVPYIGLVSVSGKTCRQATEEIKARLERDYYYKATVIMGLDQAAKALGRVYISGQVHKQGAIEIPANETFTASKAILAADGFGEFANKKKVKVVRTLPDGEKKTFELNMEDILDKGETEKDLPLLPDDYILVPQRLINL